MNKRIIIGSVGILLILGTGFLLKNFFASKKKEPPRKPIVSAQKFVRTEKVVYQKMNAELEAFGRVISSQPLDITAEVSGRLKEGSVVLKEGQKFGAGAVIFRIDDTEQKLSLLSLKSSFMKDIASILPEIKNDFSDNFSAWQNYLQQIDLNKNLPELPSHKSDKEKTFLAVKNIYTNFYNIKSREANLEKFTTTTPFGGSIAEVFVQAGTTVNQGTKIAKLIRTENLELVVPVEVAHIGLIKAGTSVKISSEDEKMAWNGAVSRIGEIVNQQTQAIDVFIRITPNGNPVYDGMYLKAAVSGVFFDKAMIVPRNAVLNNNEVFVLENDSILKTAKINILRINKDKVLFSGLDENLDIVTEPVLGGFSGMKALPLREK